MRFMSNDLCLSGKHDNTEMDKDMLWSALMDTLSLLGEGSKRAIIYYLNKRGVNHNNVSASSLTQELARLFGDGSKLIVFELNKRIKANSMLTK
jgi:hypothetical protein